MQVRIGWAAVPTTTALGGSVRISRAAALRAAEVRDDALDSAIGASLRLRNALGDLNQLLSRPGVAGRPARSGSTAGIGIDTAPRYTSLTSTEEVNTTPTSFGPVDPSWAGGSTAAVGIGGTYDGDNGTQTITIQMSSDGDRTVGGPDSIRLKMVDQDGYRIQTVAIAADAPAGTVARFRNGIEITLSDGVIQQDDTFTFDVSTETPTSVDPDKPLAGTGAQSAKLESGFSVVAGTFEVQGVTITIDPAVDTLNDVLGRITASAAGVDAGYDAATDSVVLTRRDASDGDIVVGNDTTGFLAATKLDGASAVLGHTPDQDKVISDVAALSGVSSGSVIVNGTTVSFDVSTDTLQDVLDRISDEADVSATMLGDTVSLQSRDGADLTLTDGGGLFAALNVATGTFRATRGTGPNRQDAIEALEDVTRELDELMRVSATIEQPPTVLSDLRASIEDLVREAAGGSDRDVLRTRVGIDFDFRSDAREAVSLRYGGRAFERAFAKDRHVLGDFFGVDERDGSGLLDQLIERLDDDRDALRSLAGTSTGLLLRTVA